MPRAVWLPGRTYYYYYYAKTRPRISRPTQKQVASATITSPILPSARTSGDPAARLAHRRPPPENGSSAALANSPLLPASPDLIRGHPAAAASAAAASAAPQPRPLPAPLRPVLTPRLVRVHQLGCSQRRRRRPQGGRGWRGGRRLRRLLGDERRGAHGPVRDGHLQGVRPRRPAPQQARVRRPAKAPPHRHHRPGRRSF